MVSQHRPSDLHALPERKFPMLSCSHIPWSIFFAVLILATICIHPVSADEPACYQRTEIGNIYISAQSADMNTPVEISAQMAVCDQCYYHWYVSYNNAGYLEQISEFTTSSFTTTFTRPGTYEILLKASNPKPTCGMDDVGSATMSKTLVVTDPCPAVRSLVEIGQQRQTSQVGETSVWWATSSPSCPGCTFTWSLWKFTGDSWVQYPIGENDVHTENQRPEFFHMFTEPGDYKINARMNNPQNCENSEGQLNYASMSINHRVTSASGSTEQGTSPQVVDPAPLSTTSSVTPAATATLSLQGTQLQVTNTVIPAATQPVMTIPQGTVQPSGQATGRQAGTPAPTPAGADNPASGQVSAVPTDRSASTGIDVPAAQPTRTPGFTLPLALCAGLLVLIMRRK